ncbi:MAG: hypothetical protein WEB13_09710 [Dehalococcoidia bacterium]
MDEIVLGDEITLAGLLGFALVRSEAEPALFVAGGYRTILTFILDRARLAAANCSRR